MKKSYRITLVSNDCVKNMEFCASDEYAEKVFFELAANFFVSCNSAYTEISLFAGESRVNQIRFTKSRLA